MAGAASATALRAQSRNTRVRNDENANPNVGDPRQVNPAAVNVTVAGAGLDMYIPTIPEVRESDIKSKFKVKVLTPIDGRPTYEKMRALTQELGRNALGIQVPFGGGKRGCLGLVYSQQKFQAEANHEWSVPESEGAYPNFAADATEDDKKKEISQFIEREKGIKTVEATEELLKGMFIEAIDEDYVVELKEGLREYDGRTLQELLSHVSKYAKMDDEVHRHILLDFQKPPNMDLPIDKYFAKQEECRKLVADNENPITDAAMVLQLTQHMGKVPSLTKKTVKFKKRSPDLRTWAISKEFFRDLLEDIDDENRAMGSEKEHMANSATMMNTAEQTARDEIGQKMSGSFDALACAAVAKSDMLDKHTATIIALTTTVTELTATNKKLVDQLAVALASCARLPPGMGAIPAPTPAPPAPTEITGHTLNSAGVACPATFNPKVKRWYFVTTQECKTCGKKTSHTPENCLELPQNAERKARMISRRGKTN
jgi:hypothetical protein